ncbi:AAA family ATPase [Candidatus Gracilibacteria bacterium]|nr:AAA family ATPase [Candidatus Gracilibacteria bacterium]
MIIDSANIRSVLPEHIMFYGQPGLGKTTLASLISNELGAHLKTIAAPALQKSGDVVSLLINMEPNTILFIDEIHRLKAPLEEIMYSAMEDKVVDLVMGKGQGVSLGRFDLNDFMIVGATTQLGKVSKPLKDRFPTLFQLEPYDEVDILELLDKNLDVLKIKMTEDARIVLARRCRGVPRIANNILKRFKDLQVVHKIREIESLETPVTRLVKARLPSLFIGLLGGLVAAAIISNFESFLNEYIVLASFIPVIVYLSDAIGTQSQTLIIRMLALEPQFSFRRYLSRELKIGALLGLIFAVSLFAAAFFWLGNIRPWNSYRFINIF